MDRFPDWLVPMAATLTDARVQGPEWTFERKYDGIRMLAFKQGPTVRLLSRNRLPLNASYPSVADAVAALPADALVLDGEAAWDRGTATIYQVFDVLWDGDRPLTALRLDERRSRLRTLPLRAPLAAVEPLTGPRPWERACREGWEGVIAKRLDSVYEHRRSRHWLKMKCESTGEFTIVGFTDPQGSRRGLGALLVGHWRDGTLHFAGKVGTGLDTSQLLELRARLDAIEVTAPPFAETKGLPRIRTHWVQPQIVVRVAFLEWTDHGKLRHARLTHS